MVVDSLIVPQCVYRPGTFTGLMSLYESNYIKLCLLASDLQWAANVLVSSSARDQDLHVEVLRREPYTTTLRLTYWFKEVDGQSVADPDLLLRVYHDARLAEAVSCADFHRHEKLRELTASRAHTELDRRWRLNMMLNKWLDYLFEVGHILNRAERAVS
jgi:uncharacterized protein YqiB (DUF1249 family)